MNSTRPNWHKWQAFFAQRRDRPLPETISSTDYSRFPASLGDSLAIFQLGESGGGTIIQQARESRIPGVDADYANAIEHFVREENRHADILENAVHLLGATLIKENWTATLFVYARRLIGLRLKVLVLLVAEVVGMCYYKLLASRMPNCELQAYLDQMADDERAHLRFHSDFLRSQATTAWRRGIFSIVWWPVTILAGLLVSFDHRNSIRDMGLTYREVWSRWLNCSKLVAQRVTGSVGAKSSSAVEIQPQRSRVANGTVPAAGQPTM